MLQPVWMPLAARPAVRRALAYGGHGVLAAVILALGYTITTPAEWLVAVVAALAIGAVGIFAPLGRRVFQPFHHPVAR